MLRDRRLNLGIAISTLFHIILFILLSKSGAASITSYEDIREVTFIDQSYRPEVARVVSKGSVWGGIKERYPETDDAPYGGEITTPKIDINTKLDRSQAKIDLERYVTEEGIGDVVKVGSRANGTVKTTEEILAEKPISLAKNLPRGAGGTGGVGTSGGIGVQAERPTIKIEKKLPLPKTSEIGKQVKRRPERKLKMGKGETQISLAGPIANRTILKKMLPKYPQWALQKGISGVVKVRIWVEPSGYVREGKLIEVSSGYPDLDQAVLNALREWRFAPLPKNVVPEAQWGIISFRFVCG